MLRDMSEIGPVMKAFDKAAGAPLRTAMLMNAREPFQQALVEPVNLKALFICQILKVESHDEDRPVAKNIRPGESSDSFYSHQFTLAALTLFNDRLIIRASLSAPYIIIKAPSLLQTRPSAHYVGLARSRSIYASAGR
jgi:hypothetical protein